LTSSVIPPAAVIAAEIIDWIPVIVVCPARLVSIAMNLPRQHTRKSSVR
jgi:hypothetical protein